MTISIDRLSIWEIAHRWHDADPSHSKTIADIPLEVKDSLRNLAAEVYYERLYSTLLLEREAENHKPVFKRNWPYFWKKTWFIVPVSHYNKEFRSVINNKIDPDFLQTVMITHWELDYWCKEFQVPFPEFWVRAIVLGGSKAPFPGSVDFIEEDEDEAESEDGISSDEKTKSENHRRAALQRHEPINQLKRECISFLKTQKGSNKKIAKLFYDSLPDDKKKLLTVSNGPITFERAISEFKNDADKDWIKEIHRTK